MPKQEFESVRGVDRALLGQNMGVCSTMRDLLRLRSEEGFTLLELMVIVLIIAVLLGIAVGAYIPASRAASSVACRENQKILEEGASLACCQQGAQPPADLVELAPYVRDFGSVSVCPLDDTPLLYDPVTMDVSCPNHP